MGFRSLLLCLLCALATTVAGAQGIDKIKFTTNSGGPNRVWDSDDVTITLSGTTLMIYGAMPTGDTEKPIQTITMRLRNFRPNDTYPKTFRFNSLDAKWQNYAGTTGMCNCQDGSFTITKIDPDGRLPGGDDFVVRATSGACAFDGGVIARSPSGRRRRRKARSPGTRPWRCSAVRRCWAPRAPWTERRSWSAGP